MIGSKVSTRNSRLARNPVRVAISAKARPSAVVPAPTETAMMSEFQATPQPRFTVRQSRPQMFLENSFSKNSAGARLSSLSRKALTRMRTTGQKMNAATRAMTSPIDPTTNTSPLMAPRAAALWVNRNRKAPNTRSAP